VRGRVGSPVLSTPALRPVLSFLGWAVSSQFSLHRQGLCARAPWPYDLPVGDGSEESCLTFAERAVELARPWALLAVYVALATLRCWILAIPVATVTCLAAFVQMHDAIHASLGLSKRANDAVLTLSGLLLLKSGHALRATHLRHHGRCLGQDDPEGAPATWPLWRALVRGPFHILALRLDALRIAPRTRNVQVMETLATAAVLALAVGLYISFGSLTGLAYWLVAATLSSLMPIWAAYLPHRLASHHPAVRAAGRLAQMWTPILTSFAFHHAHHDHPKVPTALLPVVGRSAASENHALR
jgi:fatty acid desaturase